MRINESLHLTQADEPIHLESQVIDHLIKKAKKLDLKMTSTDFISKKSISDALNISMGYISRAEEKALIHLVIDENSFFSPCVIPYELETTK